MRRLVLLGPVVALAITGCGGSASGKPAIAASTSSTRVTAASGRSPGALISTRSLPGLGSVLVTGQGRTLYLFVSDGHRKVTCVNTCAQLWPPVKVVGGQKPAASGHAKPSLLGADPDPEGGRVVTYAGRPLYTYIADSTSTSASGQGLNTSGGLWYVLSPSGQAITKAP